MTPQEYLTAYAQAWSALDAIGIQSACDSGYRLVDPNVTVTREMLPGYLENLKQASGGAEKMDISGVVMTPVGDHLVAGCFWEAGSLKGTGLIVVGALGVKSENIALL